MSDPVSAAVALIANGSQLATSLSVPFEERIIYYALGKEFRNGDPALPFRIPEIFLRPGSERARIVYDGATLGAEHRSVKKLPAIPLVKRKDNEWEYLNIQQGVRYVVRVIDEKKQFVQALQTPGVHVLYSGHARYGRGPCFGAGGSSKGEEWEEGHPGQPPPAKPNPNNDGIFRMGYPFIGVDLAELFEHGYTANLVEAVTRPSAGDCDPDLRPHLGALRGRTAAELHPSLLARLRVKDPTRKWWSYRAGRKNEMHVVHHADWQHTSSDPDDIGAITPTCRVLTHLGCSSFIHNYPVVRTLKKWVRAGNERYAYWTSNLSDWAPDHYFFQRLLTYDQFNSYQPLEKSLKYAVDETNKMLQKDQDACRIK